MKVLAGGLSLPLAAYLSKRLAGVEIDSVSVSVSLLDCLPRLVRDALTVMSYRSSMSWPRLTTPKRA